MLGTCLRYVWDMSGTCLGNAWTMVGTLLGHVWDMMGQHNYKSEAIVGGPGGAALKDAGLSRGPLGFLGSATFFYQRTVGRVVAI